MLKAKHGLSFVVVAIFVLPLVACGDDDSDFATRPSEGSSSSVTPQSSDGETSVSTGTMTDSRDGQTYKTVTIGSQTWMAENLNYETSNSYCYNDSASYCIKYGHFYTWAAAMDSVGTWSTNGKGCGYTKTCSPTYPVRGVCPEGWHLPDSTEWATLFTAVGGQSTAGKMLKSTSGWNDYGGESGNGTDAFAFSALPAGGRNEGGGYNGEGNGALFWSSAEGNSGSAYFMDLYFGHSYASLYGGDKDYGFSVRCLKD